RHGAHASRAGQTGTSPGVVRKPTTPQNAAGIRSEPPRSEPWARGPRPVASATAAPPLDPPHVSAGFHGLRVGPKTALKVFAPAPNSGVLVLPRTIAPAAFNRSTTRASSAGTRCSKIFEPSVVRIPRVRVRSLIETGTPWSGPSLAPRLSAPVARFASASACSAATVQYALRLGFTFSIRARAGRVTSRGEALCRRLRPGGSVGGVGAGPGWV